MNFAKIGNYRVYFENGEEYHRIKRDVWGENSYYVELEKENPVIIDAGANIGVTTLYFKRLFPQSTIIAIEPMAENITLWKKNMFENQVEGVTLEEVALAEYEGEKELYYDAHPNNPWYTTSGFTQGGWDYGQEHSYSRVVPTKPLSYYLETYKPDLVKLDIEGAEEKVIVAARDFLALCPHYIMEFHPVTGVGMDRIIKLFEDKGYQITVTKDGRIVPWHKAIGLSLIEAWK